MVHSLAAIPLLVPDYDEGLAFFRDALGFVVVEDTRLGPDKRWVVVSPPGGAGATIVLAVPSDERQRAKIGDQTGGRVGYFLHTSDLQVAVFVDPWGGKWDLLQPDGVGSKIA